MRAIVAAEHFTTAAVRQRTVLLAMDGHPETEALIAWARTHLLWPTDFVLLVHSAEPAKVWRVRGRREPAD